MNAMAWAILILTLGYIIGMLAVIALMALRTAGVA